MGRCWLKKRRILWGLLGNLYCAISRQPQTRWEIYRGNVWRPDSLSFLRAPPAASALLSLPRLAFDGLVGPRLDPEGSGAPLGPGGGPPILLRDFINFWERLLSSSRVNTSLSSSSLSSSSAEADKGTQVPVPNSGFPAQPLPPHPHLGPISNYLGAPVPPLFPARSYPRTRPRDRQAAG